MVGHENANMVLHVWSMVNCITSSQYLWITLFLPLLCFLHSNRITDVFLLVEESKMYFN